MSNDVLTIMKSLCYNYYVNTQVICYCRSSEGEVETPYRNVQRSAVASIKRLCKKVNQTMLLQNLHDTRVCDQLLEEEASEDIRKSGPGMF
jgi:hypothetical protein